MPPLDEHVRPSVLNVGETWARRPRQGRQEGTMSGHVYRVTEVVGSSSEGVDAAVRTAVARAAETLHALDWFEVTEVRGRIEDGRIAEYQVGVKLGFRLDE
jgi:flavin-binding protein dodecin